ncbi:MAG: IPT/TIG domain-containing protein [Sandaracinaceae bacterium]
MRETRLPHLFGGALAALTLLSATIASAQIARPMPVVQRLEPTAGPVGTRVSLIGRHFDPMQTVWLGGTELPVESRLPNRWAVTIPEGATTGDLEIRTARGNVRGPRFRVTAAAPAPVIAGFTPTSGASGTEVVIQGENFSPRVSENHVRLGTVPVVVRNANPTELRVIVPTTATTGPFTVSVTDAGEVTSTASFTIGGGTSIASFEPAMGPPRTQVTIRGTGFHRSRGRVRVYLGDDRARVVRASETEIVAEVPRGEAHSARWLVDIQGGGRATSSTSFDVRFPPEITALEPDFGAPGGRVTIRGAHFGTDIRQVRAVIGEMVLTPRDLADDHLVVELPQGVSTGPIEVTVAGLGPARSHDPLRVTTRVSIDGFTPRSGGAGSEVTIHGRGFSADVSHDHVTVSGVDCPVVRATEDQLVVRVPEARSGPLVVSVTNAGEDRTAQPFVITRVPAIASFEPTSGPPGTAVVIRGTNFGDRRGLVRVSLGDRSAQVVAVTPTELRVVVPQSASTGTFHVEVRMQGASDAAQPFTVTAPGS